VKQHLFDCLLLGHRIADAHDLSELSTSDWWSHADNTHNDYKKYHKY
jgi:hypothetical protein